MASKLLFLVFALLCATQFVECADLERRDLISDFFNRTKEAENAVQKLLQPLTNIINDVSSKAQALIQSLTNQQNQVLAASQGPLQNILQGFTNSIKGIVGNVVDFNKNASTCVTGQFDHAKNITEQTAKNIFACTQLQVQAALETLKDITDLNNQAVQLGRDAIGKFVGCFQDLKNIIQCNVNNTREVLSKSSVIISAIGADSGKLLTQGIVLPRDLTRCGNDQLAKATTDVGSLITDIGTCVGKFAQNS